MCTYDTVTGYEIIQTILDLIIRKPYHNIGTIQNPIPNS